MQKNIARIDDKMLSILPDGQEKETVLPTKREILRLIGNIKSETADDSRRTMRIINKLRDPSVLDLTLESDDMAFLLKKFEVNPMGLVAWMQGQILDIIESADKVA